MEKDPHWSIYSKISVFEKFFVGIFSEEIFVTSYVAMKF